MRVRISAKPTLECIDGVQLTRFQKGCEYEVGSHLAELLIVEGWAEPVEMGRSSESAPGFARAIPDGPAHGRERRTNIMRLGRRTQTA